jgi:hypothetical protein
MSLLEISGLVFRRPNVMATLAQLEIHRFFWNALAEMKLFQGKNEHESCDTDQSPIGRIK